MYDILMVLIHYNFLVNVQSLASFLLGYGQKKIFFTPQVFVDQEELPTFDSWINFRFVIITISMFIVFRQDSLALFVQTNSSTTI